MLHAVAAMYRNLKHQETLQVSLEIQNLKPPGFFSPPHPDQLSELNLPDNLQEVTPNLQYIQPHPTQVWNCDDIEFDKKMVQYCMHL